jgi:hypothetical protein
MLLAELRAKGLRFTSTPDGLLVEPSNALTDGIRALIRRNKAGIARELNAEAADFKAAIMRASKEADAFLSDYGTALSRGTLHICGNCKFYGFAEHPIDLGKCSNFRVEAWPFVPFWCAGFSAGASAAVPGYLPTATDSQPSNSNHALNQL